MDKEIVFDYLDSLSFVGKAIVLFKLFILRREVVVPAAFVQGWRAYQEFKKHKGGHHGQ